MLPLDDAEQFGGGNIATKHAAHFDDGDVDVAFNFRFFFNNQSEFSSRENWKCRLALCLG